MASTSSVPTRHSPALVTFHWLTVVLVFAQFVLGELMADMADPAAKLTPLVVHMILGTLTLIVMVIRIFVRGAEAKPAPATAGNAFLDRVGEWTHYGIYALVILMSLSGMGIALQAGLAPAIFGTAIILPESFGAFLSYTLHTVIAPLLGLLLLLHIGAALYHQFMLKDNLIARMAYGKR